MVNINVRVREEMIVWSGEEAEDYKTHTRAQTHIPLSPFPLSFILSISQDQNVGEQMCGTFRGKNKPSVRGE